MQEDEEGKREAILLRKIASELNLLYTVFTVYHLPFVIYPLIKQML